MSMVKTAAFWYKGRKGSISWVNNIGKLLVFLIDLKTQKYATESPAHRAIAPYLYTLTPSYSWSFHLLCLEHTPLSAPLYSRCSIASALPQPRGIPLCSQRIRRQYFLLRRKHPSFRNKRTTNPLRWKSDIFLNMEGGRVRGGFLCDMLGFDTRLIADYEVSSCEMSCHCWAKGRTNCVDGGCS